MIIGDKELFAVEVGGSGWDCELIVWFLGDDVDRSLSHASLEDMLFVLEAACERTSEPLRSSLSTLELEPLCETLDEALFTGARVHERALDEQWGLHLIELGTTACNLFVLDDGRCERIVVQSGTGCRECSTVPGYIHDVLSRTASELRRRLSCLGWLDVAAVVGAPNFFAIQLLPEAVRHGYGGFARIWVLGRRIELLPSVEPTELLQSLVAILAARQPEQRAEPELNCASVQDAVHEGDLSTLQRYQVKWATPGYNLFIAHGPTADRVVLVTANGDCLDGDIPRGEFFDVLDGTMKRLERLLS